WQVADINELRPNVVSCVCFVGDDAGDMFAQATLPRGAEDQRDRKLAAVVHQTFSFWYRSVSRWAPGVTPFRRVTNQARGGLSEHESYWRLSRSQGFGTSGGTAHAVARGLSQWPRRAGQTPSLRRRRYRQGDQCRRI